MTPRDQYSLASARSFPGETSPGRLRIYAWSNYELLRSPYFVLTLSVYFLRVNIANNNTKKVNVPAKYKG